MIKSRLPVLLPVLFALEGMRRRSHSASLAPAVQRGGKWRRGRHIGRSIDSRKVSGARPSPPFSWIHRCSGRTTAKLIFPASRVS